MIATTGGAASGFLQLKLEPGWTLKRRAYGKKNLGHLYVYRDSAPVPPAQPASRLRLNRESSVAGPKPEPVPLLSCSPFSHWREMQGATDENHGPFTGSIGLVRR